MGAGKSTKRSAIFATARSGAWLTPQRIRTYLWLLALANALTLAWLIITAHSGLDPHGRLLGTDFVSFWAAGQVLHLGGNPYDPAVHRAAESVVWPDQKGYTAFFYPPLFLLWCWPLGLAGYFSALFGWLATSIAGWIAVVRAWGEGRLYWLAMAAFPPLFLSITHGQTSLLLAALLGGGLLASARDRPVLAGVLFGLAAFKPQFGILVPVIIAAARQWRTIGWAALTVVASAGAATLAFGPGIWTAWQAIAGPAQAAMAEGAVGFGKMQSLFAGLRLLGLSTGLAYAAQAVLALMVATTLAILAHKRGMTKEVGAATLAGALLATPFVLDYDFALLAFPLVTLMQGRARAWERTAGAMAFAVGAFARPVGAWIGVPVGTAVVLALFVVLVRRAVASADAGLGEEA